MHGSELTPRVLSCAHLQRAEAGNVCAAPFQMWRPIMWRSSSSQTCRRHLTGLQQPLRLLDQSAQAECTPCVVLMVPGSSPDIACGKVSMRCMISLLVTGETRWCRRLTVHVGLTRQSFRA